MTVLKRVSFWVLIGVLVLGTLSAAVSHFSPKLLNSPILKEKIQAGFLTGFNTHVDYRKIEISFFPYPHLVIHQGAMSVDRQARSEFNAAAIYPKLLALFTGNIEFSRVDVDAPEIKIMLTEETAEKSASPTEAIIRMLRQISPVMAYLADSVIDDITVRTRNARLDLYKGERLLFSVWDLDGKIEVPGKRLQYSFHCRSNFWDRLSHKGEIHRQKKTAQGDLKIRKLRLQPLQAQFFSAADLTLSDAAIDLALRYVTDGQKELSAEMESVFSDVSLARGKESVTFSGARADAGIVLDGSGIVVSVSSLNLASPKIDLSGKFSMDPLASDVLLEINGKNADVASVRKAALLIAGHVPDVADTFHILRAGHVPEFTISSHAASVRGLDDLENIHITGRMQRGAIYIPEIDFDLAEVHGQAVISKGILEGTDLSARLGNTSGTTGRMTIGLKGEEKPFRLDIILDADTSQLPPVLSRLIDNEPFQRELNRIQNVKGRASGRLRLGDSLSAIRPRIEVSRFALSADYQRIPVPITVTGEGLTIEDTQLSISRMTASSPAGNLAFRKGRIDWGKTPVLYVNLGPSELSADVFYPWLRSLKVFEKRLMSVPSVKGTVNFSAVELAGNFRRPESVTFTMEGRVEGLAAEVNPLGDTVHLDQGVFTANRKTLQFSGLKLRLLDTSLNASGRIDGYIDGPIARTVDFGGVLGPRAVEWASDLVRLPPELTVRPPLWISSARLIMGKGESISFSGELAVEKGPGVEINISDGEKGFTIDHLRIKDDVSDAVLKLSIKNRLCDLSFKGRLEKSTLDACLTDNQVVTGWVEGDIQTWIRMDDLIKSTAVGKLTAEGVMVFLPITSLKVEALSVEAVSNRLNIEAARILWIDEQIDLRGRVAVQHASIRIDLDVSMEHFDWSTYGNLITGRKAHAPGTSDLAKEMLPLEGIIRFKSRHFRYSRYTWRPFEADVTFRPDDLMIDVQQANLCGISMPAMASIRPKSLDLTIATEVNDESLDDTLHCLGRSYVLGGLFDLSGYASIEGDGPPEILPALTGEWTFAARDGRIDRLTVLAKIFELLNVAEIFKLKLPDLRTEGFGYRKIDIHWRLDGGKIYIDSGLLDSSAMEIAFTGELDLVREQADVRVLVAPLQTLNFIVKNIPVLRNILAGTFISIPFRVAGDLQNPDVSAMNPKDVGSELLKLMKRTADMSVQIIQPLTNFNQKQD